LVGNSLSLADLVFWESLQHINLSITTPTLKKWASELTKNSDVQRATNELCNVKSIPVKVSFETAKSVEKKEIKPTVENKGKQNEEKKVARLVQYDQEVSHYVVRVMKDFSLSRKEAEALWEEKMSRLGKVKYMTTTSTLSAEEIKGKQLKILSDLKELQQRLNTLQK